MSIPFTYQGPALSTRQVLFTGLTINATESNRTAVVDTAAETLRVGSVVIADPFNWEFSAPGDVNPTHKGQTVTQPQTNFLHLQKFVVLGLGQINRDVQNSRGGVAYFPRQLTVAPASEVEFIMTRANQTAGATFLVPANGSYALQPATVTTTDAATVMTNVLNLLRIGCGLSLDTVDTSGTAALARVRFGPPSCVVLP